MFFFRSFYRFRRLVRWIVLICVLYTYIFVCLVVIWFCFYFCCIWTKCKEMYRSQIRLPAYLYIVYIENNNHCLFEIIYGNLVLVLSAAWSLVYIQTHKIDIYISSPMKITLLDMMVAFNQNDEIPFCVVLCVWCRLCVVEELFSLSIFRTNTHLCVGFFCHFLFSTNISLSNGCFVRSVCLRRWAVFFSDALQWLWL